MAGDGDGCWAGWGRGANRGRGWRGLAMTAVQAMQSVHALLAVQVKLAEMAMSAGRGRIGHESVVRWAQDRVTEGLRTGSANSNSKLVQVDRW